MSNRVSFPARWFCPAAIFCLFLLLISPAAGGGGRVRAKSISEDLQFTIRIENFTGRDIHVRIAADGRVIADEGGRWQTPNEINVAGWKRRPGEFPRRDVKVMLNPAILSLEVEESDLLKTRQTFGIAGFADRPEQDFRLSVRADGMSLAQDLEMGDTLTESERRSPEASSLRRHERSVYPNRAIYVINASGRALSGTLRAGENTVLSIDLPSELPKSRVHDADHSPPYPYVREVIPLPRTLATLILSETSPPRTWTIDISNKKGGIYIWLHPNSVEVQSGATSW
jgi:hypothetical protein